MSEALVNITCAGVTNVIKLDRIENIDPGAKHMILPQILEGGLGYGGRIYEIETHPCSCHKAYSIPTRQCTDKTTSNSSSLSLRVALLFVSKDIVKTPHHFMALHFGRRDHIALHMPMSGHSIIGRIPHLHVFTGFVQLGTDHSTQTE
jgi:hypothetical protein